MDILERDYFGLKYLDVNSVSQWLDPRKPIKKQSKDKGEKTRSHSSLLWVQITMNETKYIIYFQTQKYIYIYIHIYDVVLFSFFP